MPRRPLRVIIAGGGLAAAEAALCLHDLAPGLVSVRLLAPERSLRMRPLAVLEPFGGHPAAEVTLDELLGDVIEERITGALATVALAGRRIVTTDEQEHDYDALLVAVGARPAAAFDDALTFGTPGGSAAVTGLLEEIDSDEVTRVAFVVPPGPTWLFPLYELALMTAHQFRDRGAPPALTLITPEPAPLARFGYAVSRDLATLLERAGIALVPAAAPEVINGREVRLWSRGPTAAFDRIVSLPVLAADPVGLPADSRGFLPVDDHGGVRGTSGVLAAGDVTQHETKHGGLACLQADAAAEWIAAAAGAPLRPRPYRPRLRGLLLTGDGLRVLEQGTVRHDPGRSSPASLTSPAGKIAAVHLGRRLAALTRI